MSTSAISTAAPQSGSSVIDFLRPSVITNETGKLLSSGPGVDDCLEAVINGLEWMAHFGNESVEDAKEDLEVINQGLAVPGFIGSVGNLKEKFSAWYNRDGKIINVFDGALKTVNKGAKSSFFFDSINLISLKESMQVAKGIFWGSLFCMETISAVEQAQEARAHSDKAQGTTNRDKKGILEHRVQIAYLNVLKAVNSIALASIALVSILFASLAQGFIFSPVVFLSLTSTWLVLTFVTHFYEKLADSWDRERKDNAKLSGAVPAKS